MNKEDHTITVTFNEDRPLGKTILPMMSEDYKERLKAEYKQTRYRLQSLNSMLDKWAKDELDYTLPCPQGLLMRQSNVMAHYLKILELRAEIEGVELI